MASKTVLLISIEYGPGFVDASLLGSLKSRATIKQATTASEAMSVLTDSPPHAICITDGGIRPNEQTGLLNSLVAYTKAGGRVIFASSFSSFVRLNDIQRLFTLWDLPWKRGSYKRDSLVLNPRNSTLAASGLACEYYAKALFLENVADTAKVYMSHPGSGSQTGVLGSSVAVSETFAAYAPVELGFVGFLGDVNPGIENEKVVLAMCGLVDHGNVAIVLNRE